jgi:hypothetical protein
MSDEQNAAQQIDPSNIGCRVVDVHNALQAAFTTFVESGDGSIEGLARTIHSSLSEIPAFLIGDAKE